MKKPLAIKIVTVVTISIVIIFLLAIPFMIASGFSWKRTLVSQSPNGKFQVEQLDFSGPIDRNFKLILTELNGSKETEIFRSPDEGPIGGEQIIWSNDSDHFLLIGENFYTTDHSEIGNQKILYLLYDLKTNDIYCNATQSDLPRFSKNKLFNIAWNDEEFNSLINEGTR